MRRTPLVAALLSTALVVPLGLLSPTASAAEQPGTTPRRGRTASPELSTALEARRPPQPGGGRPVLRDGRRGRQLPGDRLPHPRRDGRLLDAADQAARRPVVRVDGTWLARVARTPAAGATSGWTSAPTTASRITRTDFAPDGIRAGLDRPAALQRRRRRRVTLAVDAHSELMQVLPVGRDTTPEPDRRTTCRTPARSTATPGLPRAGHAAGRRTRAARLRRGRRSSLTPTAHRARPGPPRPAGPGGDLPGLRHDAPQPTAATTRPTARAPAAADLRRRRARRRPTGLVRRRRLRPRRSPRRRPRRTRRSRTRAALLRAKIAARRTAHGRTPAWTCPVTGCCSAASTWSKQNLADSVQEARDLQVRVTNAGKEYPAPVGTVRDGPLVRRRLARTTRGCSRPTASTPRSPPSPPGSSTRSRTTCGRCATSA